MHERLFQNMMRHIALTDAEKKLVQQHFLPRTLRKRQYLLQAGDIARYENFVVKGLFRAFTTDADGHEHVVMFAMEDWWVADLLSFLTQTPATQHIEALEDSTVLQIEKGELENLYLAVPTLNRFFRILLQNAFVAGQQRILASISQTAEEQYLAFIQKYPSLEQRIPQNQIASYLGITPETISRIRKQQVSR